MKIRAGTISARSTARRTDLFIFGLFALLLAFILFSLTLGRYPVPVWQILRVIVTTPLKAAFNYTDVYRVVVEIVRLPRILLVTLCGMGLPLSGAAMQGVFRNSLVSPDIAGVSAGASFGGVLAIMLSLSSLGMVSLAFLFGLLALVAAFSLARLASRSGILGLVLSGVIVGAFFGALVGLGEYVADPQSR